MFRDGERFMVHTEGETAKCRTSRSSTSSATNRCSSTWSNLIEREDMPDDEIARAASACGSVGTRKTSDGSTCGRPMWMKNSSRTIRCTGPESRSAGKRCAPIATPPICKATTIRRRCTYHTTFSEIDVSCEACHGPGSLHVELANSKSLFWDRHYGYGLARSERAKTPEPQLQTCAPCHSRRGVLAPGFKPGDAFCDHYSLGTAAGRHLLCRRPDQGRGLRLRFVHPEQDVSQGHPLHGLPRPAFAEAQSNRAIKLAPLATSTRRANTTCPRTTITSRARPARCASNATCPSGRTWTSTRDAITACVSRVPIYRSQLGTPNSCSGCHVADQLESIDEQTTRLAEGIRELAGGGRERETSRSPRRSRRRTNGAMMPARNGMARNAKSLPISANRLWRSARRRARRGSKSCCDWRSSRMSLYRQSRVLRRSVN